MRPWVPWAINLSIYECIWIVRDDDIIVYQLKNRQCVKVGCICVYSCIQAQNAIEVIEFVCVFRSSWWINNLVKYTYIFLYLYQTHFHSVLFPIHFLYPDSIKDKSHKHRFTSTFCWKVCVICVFIHRIIVSYLQHFSIVSIVTNWKTHTITISRCIAQTQV